jgi:hypothetical protein
MDKVVVTITSLDMTTAYVSPNELSRLATDTSIIAMVAVPRGKGVAFDSAEPMLLFPGGARAQTQSTLLWIDGRTYVVARFSAVELLTAVSQNGTIELRVVGRLKNGAYFGGTDTIKIR